MTDRTEPATPCLQRLGYHDFLIFAEPVSDGRYQGFVRVRHHLLCGTRQVVFRAGPAVISKDDALKNAQLKADSLIHLLNDGRLSLHQTDANGRLSESGLSRQVVLSETNAFEVRHS